MEAKDNLRVLVVDDERGIRRFLNASLSAHGYKVLESAAGRDALKESVSFHPDIIILDLGLPDIDGIEVIRKIRKRNKTPIIVLSVREDASDKIAALDAGADDYLTKPFSTEELLARMRVVMRHLVPIDRDQALRAGKLLIDISKHRVTANGREVDITPTEYDVLKALVINAGRVVTHRQILREVWNKGEDLEGVLHLMRVTISNLRSKLEHNPNRPSCILTEPSIGYRLLIDS